MIKHLFKISLILWICILITGCTNVIKIVDNKNQLSNFKEYWNNTIKDKGEEFSNSQLIDANIGVFNVRISSDLEKVLKFRFEFIVKDNDTYNLYEYTQDESEYNFILRDTIKKSDINTGLTVADTMNIFDEIDMQLISSLFKEKGEFFEISFQGLYPENDYTIDLLTNNVKTYLYDSSTLIPMNKEDILSNDITLIKCLVSNYHVENNNYTSKEDIVLYIKK